MPRGRGWFGRGARGWGFGWPGNPYPFCRWFPWLPRWWWAYPAYGATWFPPFPSYAYPWYGYRPYW